jgi:predicted transcriptional regulator
MNTPAKQKAMYSIRFPVDLKAKLEAIAAKENRTVPSQIVHFLEESVQRYESNA